MILEFPSRMSDKRRELKFWHSKLISNINIVYFSQMRRFQRLTKNDERKVVTFPKITWISVEEFCFQPAFHEDVPVDHQVRT